MFDNVTFSLASAVANAGTVTVGYPTGRSQGDYDWTPGKHVLFVAGNKYTAPADFTLTFNANASDITLTNASGVTWPAESSCRLQIDRPGTDDNKNAALSALADTDRVRQISAGLFLLNLGSPDAADANGYVESQDLTSAGVFSVNTTAAAAIAAAALAGTADVPRNVVASWTGTAVLTVTGTDEYGNTIVESSASGTSLTGKKAFKTVTGISSSADITSLTVGTGDVLGLPVRVGKAGQILAEYKDGVLLPRAPSLAKLQGRVLCTDDTVGVVVSPYAGDIVKIDTVEVEGGITTNDAVLTFRIGTTNITNGAVTIATSGSAAGVKDSATPTAANTLAVGDAITCVVSGTPGGGKSAEATFTIELDDSQVLDGTFVAAVDSEATATTGDVRGTYDPVDACDGDDGYMLLVALTEPDNKGVAQYAG